MDDRSVVRDRQPLPQYHRGALGNERLAKLSRTIGVKPKENVTIVFELVTKQS
jgi:hypothetical protein